MTRTPKPWWRDFTPKSWRDLLPIHPAADMFPLLKETDPDARRKLGDDIKKQGVLEPIALLDGKLLDGRNRLDAMELADINLISVHVDTGIAEIDWTNIPFKNLPTGTDPVAYVISANIRRRHLKPEETEPLIEKLLKMDPSKSDRQVAKLTASNRNKVARIRAKLEQAGDVSLSDTRTDSKGREQPAHKPAKVAEGQAERLADESSRKDDQGSDQSENTEPTDALIAPTDTKIFLDPAAVITWFKLHASRKERLEVLAGIDIDVAEFLEVIPPKLRRELTERLPKPKLMTTTALKKRRAAEKADKAMEITDAARIAISKPSVAAELLADTDSNGIPKFLSRQEASS
jgi:hypothetical protein